MPLLLPFPLDSVAVAAALVLIPVFFAARQQLRPKPIPGIPHYPITSWTGDIPALASDTIKHGSIFERGSLVPKAYQDLGPIFQLFLGPFHRMIMVLDSQENEDVLLRSRSKALDLSPAQVTMFSAVAPESHVGQKTNDMWRRHRRITSPLMTNKYLIPMSPAIGSSARLVVNYWKQKMAAVQRHGGVCFSYQNDFEGASMDIIIAVLTGQPIGIIEDALEQLPGIQPQIDEHGGATFQVTSKPLFLSIMYLFGCLGSSDQLPATIARMYSKALKWMPGYRRAQKEFREFVDKCAADSRSKIREARALGEEPTGSCMIDMIVENEGIPGREEFTQSELRDEVLMWTFGGNDTTSNAMQFGVKFLADAPQVQRALRTELISALDDAPEDRPLTYADVASPERVPYLEAVVAEILRCARVAEGTRRETTAPINILGHDIPVGTDILFVHPLAGQFTAEDNADRIRSLDHVRSESSRKSGSGGRKLWQDGTAFYPERWLVDDESLPGGRRFDPKAGYSQPFGMGIRSCPGRQLAILELKIQLATLNLAFFFDKVPEALAGYRSQVHVTRSPDKAYVAPRPWSAFQTAL